MTIRERYALEFAKVLLQDALIGARKLDEVSRDKGEDGNESTAVCEDFYYIASEAAQMADTLAVALKDETPGWKCRHDDEFDYTPCRAGLKEERIAECAEDVAAAVDASIRLVSPKG